MIYRVQRAGRPLVADAAWDGPLWSSVEALEIAKFMGERPEYLPRTHAKLLYDDQAIAVIFRVEDRYVRAIATAHQGKVWRDSCVEFFFAPSGAPGSGYLNLEMNCGGTMLLHHQTRPREGVIEVEPQDIQRVETAGSLPRIIDPEIAEPITWTLAYRLPIDLVGKYCPTFKRPAAGVSWRANFYKCAEHNSHPHWVTWSLIDLPAPDFHVPEYFGTIVFK